MNIQEYREDKYFLYEAFSKEVKKVLYTAIDSEGFHFQQIQCRAKDPDSLEKKLINKNILISDDVEEEVKDIAGCRLIFYYNSDISKLVSTGLIFNSFEVITDEIKVHNVVGEAESANDYYTADHYIVKLTEDHLAKDDFEKYRDLRCEIQVQTVLNHAWSETVHNITYKSFMPSGYGSRVMNSIDARLKKIMKEYLMPAGYEFQKVKKDYQSLVEGKKIHDEDVLRNLDSCTNNNDRYNVLEHYKNNSLPYFDDHMAIENEIFDVVTKGIETSRNVEVANIETEYGIVDGKTPYQVFKICIEILEHVRYINITRLQGILFDLYRVSISDKEKKEINDFIEEFCSYDIGVLNHLGLTVQITLINFVKQYSDDELKFYKDLIVTLCGSVLKPYAEGNTWKYDSVKLGYSPLKAIDELLVLRQDAIDILIRLYSSTDEDEFLSSVSNALLKSTETPYRGNYEDDLLKIILNNSLSFIEFVNDIGVNSQYYYLVPLEEKIERLHGRSNSALKKGCEDKEFFLIHSSIVEKSIKYRDSVNSNEDYLIYKHLVDFRSVFIDEWDQRRQVKDRNDYLDSKVQEYVESIDEDNFEDWKERIERYCETKSDDMAMFQYLHKFAELLGRLKPHLAKRIIDECDANVVTILISLLNGLLLSGEKKFVYGKMNNDINNSSNFHIHARLFLLNNNVDRGILKNLLDKSIEIDDKWTVIQSITAVVDAIDIYHDKEVESVLMPAIKYLTDKKEAGWVHQLWFRDKKDILIQYLEPEQVDVIINNLIYLDDIDYHAESVLKVIAEKFPEKVISLFKSRLEYESSGTESSRYDSIPYEFYELDKELSKYPDACIDEIITWYDQYDGMFTYRGANLIKIIYPSYLDELENKLINLVQTGDLRNIEMVISILRAYQGQTFLHKTCMAIVENLDDGHELLRDIKIVLEDSGVVSGEFGFVQLYQNKIEEIKYWQQSQNPKVVEFSNSYIKGLERQIAAEQRRAEQGVAARKLEYGELD